LHDARHIGFTPDRARRWRPDLPGTWLAALRSGSRALRLATSSMSELRLDWLAIARDLAGNLRSVGDVGVIRLLLDDAEQDALTLGAPPNFWSQVLSEYERIPASPNGPDANLIRRMILARSKVTMEMNPTIVRPAGK
jgi:hypothetical protein